MKIKKKIKRVLLIVMSLLMTIVSANNSLGSVKAVDSSDDWSIKINWGDPKDNLPNSWCPEYGLQDSTIIKTTITLEHKDDGKEYAPGSVQISINDIYDIIDYEYRKEHNWDGLTESKLVDISCSADKKGSTGNNDWEYTTSGSQENHRFLISNKNAISGSFTSTIQIQLEFKSYLENYSVRMFTVDYSKEIQASLEIDSHTIQSNVLNFSWKGVQDKYSINWKSVADIKEATSILSKIPQEKWDDYVYLRTSLGVTIEKGSYVLKDGWHIDFNFPSDFILDEPTWGYMNYNIFRKNKNTRTSDYQNMLETVCMDRYSNEQTTNRIMAIPKSYLDENNGVIDLICYLYGTYTNEATEKLLSSSVKQINLNNYTLGFNGELYSTSKSLQKNSSYYIYRSQMVKNYGKDPKDIKSNNQLSQLSVSSVYYGEKYNIILGDDLQYYLYSDNSYRILDKDESFVSQIEIYKPGNKSSYDFEIWGKEYNGDGSYKKIINDSISSSLRSYSILNDYGSYYDIKVKFLNIEETLAKKKLVNLYLITLENADLDKGKEVTHWYNFSYLQIEKADNGTLVNMNCSYESNLGAMAEDVENRSVERYGNTILRGVDSLEILDMHYSLGGYGRTYNMMNSEDYLYNKNDSYFNYHISSGSQEKADLLEYVLEVSYPKYVTIPVESFKFKTKDGMKTISEINETDNYISYEENVAKDKKTIIFNLKNISNYLTLEFDTSSYVYFDTCYDMYISKDDYILYNLAGKSINVNYKVSDMKVLDYYLNEIVSLKEIEGRNTHQIPNVPTSSYQGIEKEVKTSNSTYTKQLAKTNPNERYSYKLKFSAGQTKMANIILYDNLENVDSGSWKGIFQGMDMSVLESTGVDISKFKIYYSTNRDQTRDLTTEGWILSTEYSDPLNDVKSIAIDMEGYVLESYKLGYIEVLMQSPSNAVLGSNTRNQYYTSYREYDERDTSLSNPLKETKDLPSNIVVLAYGDALVNINVSKIWDDENNKFKVRPNEINVKLFRNDEEIDTCVLKPNEDWKHTFNGLRKFDESNNEYVYTVQEEEIFGYSVKYTSDIQDTEVNLSLINSPTDDIKVNIRGTKSWNDFDNKYLTRPSSITINLLRDGEKIDSVETSASQNWKYSFDNLARYKEKDVEYVYTVSEDHVDGYTASTNKSEPKGVKIKFSSDCETESVSYDWVQIFYKKDDKIYSLPKMGGRGATNTLKGAEVLVPSKDFYLHWRTDVSSDSYYGFKIDSIEEYNDEITDGNIVTNLPVSELAAIEKSENNFPESKHGNYGNNVNELYHYVSNIENSYNIINTLDKIPQSEITVTKSIYKEDINWSYGNPVGLFKIEGDDIKGNHIIKYVSAEFTENFVNNTPGIQESGSTRIDISQKVKLPVGEYRVSEIDNLRYKLTDIDTTNEKSKTSSTVTFDLEANSEGSARFTNRCTNYNDLSHSDIVVNEIKKGK